MTTSEAAMGCRKVRRIIQYHVRNKLLSPQKFVHHVMLLLFSFCDEKQLLSGCPSLYQNKLQEQGVHDVVNRNKRKFEPYGDITDQDFFQLNENSIKIWYPHSQIKSDETPMAEYPNENDSEDRVAKKK